MEVKKYNLFLDEYWNRSFIYQDDKSFDLWIVLDNLSLFHNKFNYFITLSWSWKTIEDWKKYLKTVFRKDLLSLKTHKKAMIFEYKKILKSYFKNLVLDKNSFRTQQILFNFTGIDYLDRSLSYIYSKRNKVIDIVKNKYKNYLDKDIEKFNYFWIFEKHKSWLFHVHVLSSHPIDIFNWINIDLKPNTIESIFQTITQAIQIYKFNLTKILLIS